MSKATNSEYMLLFRGTDWHKGLSPEEMQEVVKQMYGWFDRLTAEGKAKAGRPLFPEGKIVSQKKGRSVADGPFAESKEAIGGVSCSKWVASTGPQRLPKIFRA